MNDPVNYFDPFGLESMGGHGQGRNGYNKNGIINSNQFWTGINNINTFSTVAAIGLSTDLKTAPLAAFFAGAAFTTEAMLCWEPREEPLLPDKMEDFLIDELIPFNGVKAKMLKEVYKASNNYNIGKI